MHPPLFYAYPAEGSAAFLDKAGRVALMPGACWSEARVGTNAIGTALAITIIK